MKVFTLVLARWQYDRILVDVREMGLPETLEAVEEVASRTLNERVRIQVLSDDVRQSGMQASKFRKKPVVVEAMRWTGSGVKGATEIIDWVLANGGTARYHQKEFEQKGSTNWPEVASVPEHIRVDTLDSTASLFDGDWMMRGTVGEFYPCTNDVFRQSYELVEPEPVVWDWVERLAFSVIQDECEMRERTKITVHDVGYGMFKVVWQDMALNVDTGEYDYEPTPSERTEEWLVQHRFGRDEAIRRAQRDAATIKVNGQTATELVGDRAVALAADDAWPPAKAAARRVLERDEAPEPDEVSDPLKQS